MRSRKVIVVGAGDQALSAAETVRSAGLILVGFVSDRRTAPTLLGLPVLSALPSEHVEAGGAVVVAIGSNVTRQRVWEALTPQVPDEQLPAVVHASASVASGVHLAPGVLVMQGALLASGAKAHTGVLVNSGAVLEHESVMEDFSSLAPRSVTGGRVEIGRRTAISIGAVVRHGLTIGDDTVVGAASYVHRDLPAGVVAYGVPARVIRTRSADDPYL